ncbi:acyltransferase family protein [Pseudarthrobacter phenanthrenivorans]|uniref:acyltransferase family protein n=1 Tax=Pseudarthrobacter phenanthrenivorans TaxID=361575 RepID=UPI002F351004
MGDNDQSGLAPRLTALDGLRGVAAAVVLVHHCLLTSPGLDAAVNAQGAGAGATVPWIWWATYTPLHLLWAGREAVYVFFILSGYVIALPFLKAGRPRWRGFYAKRVIRIYLPVWASILVALLLAWVVPRENSPDLSNWLNAHSGESNITRDLLLLLGTGQLNSPLWSLQWELLFSLLLPLYLLAASRFQRLWVLWIFVLALFIGLAQASNMAAPVFLPMFGMGVLMAARHGLLIRWAARLPQVGWYFVVAVSLFLLLTPWLFPRQPGTIGTAAIGGSLMVFTFLGCRPAVTLGNGPFLQWLGSRSFSLYLIHEPVVVSVAFAFHASDALLVAVVAIPLSLAASELFFRGVERPSLQLARGVGSLLVARSQRRSASVPQTKPAA